MFELYGLHLFGRKKFEDALELSSVKSPVDISKTPRINWRRAADAGQFFPNGVEEIQWLAASETLHVPMGKRAIDRIPQEDQQFDLRVVVANPFRCRLLVKLSRCSFSFASF